MKKFTSMTILSPKQIQDLDVACQKLSEEGKVRHVGVINQLGHLVAGGFRKGITPLLEDEKVRMTYMQMQLDFKMRQELDEVLGPIDYSVKAYKTTCHQCSYWSKSCVDYS